MFDYKKTKQFRILAQQQAIQNEIAVRDRNLSYRLDGLSENISRLKRVLFFSPNIVAEQTGNIGAGNWAHGIRWVVHCNGKPLNIIQRCWAYIVFRFIFEVNTKSAFAELAE